MAAANKIKISVEPDRDVLNAAEAALGMAGVLQLLSEIAGGIPGKLALVIECSSEQQVNALKLRIHSALENRAFGIKAYTERSNKDSIARNTEDDEDDRPQPSRSAKVTPMDRFFSSLEE